MEEPKWITMMAKNVHQVVSQDVETLTDAPKQEEHKFNLCFTSFETKEGQTEKELVQRLNTELLQGQMRLRAKVVATTWQPFATTQTSTSATCTCLSTMLFKFATNENYQVALRGCEGLARIKLGLDENLTPTQQVHKLEPWSLFKEAKAVGKCAFWRTVELFINDIHICLPFSI